jgi:hypothetical protein
MRSRCCLCVCVCVCVCVSVLLFPALVSWSGVAGPNLKMSAPCFGDGVSAIYSQHLHRELIIFLAWN